MLTSGFDFAATWWSALRKHSDELGGRPIQLLIGPSADAACAARSLMRLMKGSRMLFDGHPVSQLAHVRELAADHIANSLDESHSDVYIFVGCGATVDITSLLDMNYVTAVMIIDSQRPMHLANMRDPKITVWDSERAAHMITRFFAHHLRRTSGAASAALLRATGRRADKQKTVKPRQPRQPRAEASLERSDDDPDYEQQQDAVDTDDGSGSSSGMSTEDEDEGDDGPSRSPSLTGAEASSYNPAVDEEDLELGADGQRLDWRSGAVPPRLERLYYSTRWADQAAAMSMYDLALSIGQMSDTIIWNASVGIVDIFRRRGMTAASYEVEYHKLAQAVQQSAASRRTLSRLGDITSDSNNGVRGAASSAWRLKPTFDDALFCLQHTSLLAALELDAVLAARLRIHRPAEGHERVEELLAHVGISQEKARRSWPELPVQQRQDILRRLGEEMLRLRITDASVQRSRPVVSKAVGFGPEVSPFDACALFYAESTCPPSQRSVYASNELLRKHERAQFWRASDVLDAAPASKEFAGALELALQCAEAVSAATSEILQPGGLASMRHLQYTLLGHRAGMKLQEELWHPFRLEQLAVHIAEATGVDQPKLKRRPVLIGCPMPSSTTGGPVSEQYRIVCVVPDTFGATDIVPVIGEIAAGRMDVEDDAAVSHHLDATITTVTGQPQALSFLETVHLRLAR